jgi:hypothetical protein
MGTGLALITVLQKSNCVVDVPNFTPGTTDPVVVVATKINQSRSAHLTLRVTDIAGNVTVGDPIVRTVEIPAGASSAGQRFRRIPQSESFVTVQNGAPGLTKVRLTINGGQSRVVALAPGETRLLNVSSDFVRGNNTIVLRGYGQSGASALVVISDGASPRGEKRTAISGAAEHGVRGQNLAWGP